MRPEWTPMCSHAGGMVGLLIAKLPYQQEHLVLPWHLLPKAACSCGHVLLRYRQCAVVGLQHHRA